MDIMQDSNSVTTFIKLEQRFCFMQVSKNQNWCDILEHPCNLNALTHLYSIPEFRSYTDM